MTKKTIPMQVDGEATRVNPAIIEIRDEELIFFCPLVFCHRSDSEDVIVGF